MSVLENSRNKFDENLRILYVPEGISWEQMMDHGVKLIKMGYSVRVHEHSSRVDCTPNGATVRCGQLTVTENGAILVPEQDGGATE